MDPVQYCIDKAAAPGSSLHYALLFAPRPVRHDLLGLHAWRAEVLETVDECSDPAVARVKLNFWREELERAFAGTARHPAGQVLQQAIERCNLPEEPFRDMLDGASMDLEYNAYPDFRALTTYCHRVGGSTTRLAATICAATAPEDLRFAHDLGMALPLTGKLRRLRRDLQAGRLYLPLDEVEAHGLSAESLLARRDRAAEQALFRVQAERAASFYDSAFERLAGADRRQLLPLTVLARLYRALLDEMQREDLPLLDRRIHLTPLRKLWIAWRTARRERRAATTRKQR
jgi:phytoene synthase